MYGLTSGIYSYKDLTLPKTFGIITIYTQIALLLGRETCASSSRNYNTIQSNYNKIIYSSLYSHWDFSIKTGQQLLPAMAQVLRYTAVY